MDLRRRIRIAYEVLTNPLWHFAWRLQGLRRCPRCRLTWEQPLYMEKYQGGVCHDCHGDDVVAYWEAEKPA